MRLLLTRHKGIWERKFFSHNTLVRTSLFVLIAGFETFDKSLTLTAPACSLLASLKTKNEIVFSSVPKSSKILVTGWPISRDYFLYKLFSTDAKKYLKLKTSVRIKYSLDETGGEKHCTYFATVCFLFEKSPLPTRDPTAILPSFSK